MNRRMLLILLGVAIVLVTLALVVSGRRSASSRGGEPQALFPSLKESVNDVASVRIETGGNEIRIERSGSQWRIASKGGYPAKFEEVKKTIMTVADLETIERKTTKPELYERIGVQDPGPEAESALIELRSATGESLASVIVGDSTSQGSTSYVYVRPSGEKQSWLAEGRLSPSVDLLTWVDRELVRLARERVQRVTVTQPDGETLLISRPSASQTTFDVQGVPEGRELASPNAASPTASALGYLGLEDVRPRNDAEFDVAEAVIAEYETFDGLRVRVLTWRRDGDDGSDEYWAAVETEVFEAPDDDAAAAESLADEQASAEDDDESVREEAQALSERVEGWLFKIGAPKADSLRKRMSELLKPEEEGRASPAPDQQPSGTPTMPQPPVMQP